MLFFILVVDINVSAMCYIYGNIPSKDVLSAKNAVRANMTCSVQNSNVVFCSNCDNSKINKTYDSLKQNDLKNIRSQNLLYRDQKKIQDYFDYMIGQNKGFTREQIFGEPISDIMFAEIVKECAEKLTERVGYNISKEIDDTTELQKYIKVCDKFLEENPFYTPDINNSWGQYDVKRAAFCGRQKILQQEQSKKNIETHIDDLKKKNITWGFKF